MVRVEAGELRANQEHLRRVVHPEQQQHDGPRGSVRRRRRGQPEIKTNQIFAESKEQRRHERASRYISPAKPDVGKKLEEHREQRGCQQDRHHDIGDGETHGA